MSRQCIVCLEPEDLRLCDREFTCRERHELYFHDACWAQFLEVTPLPHRCPLCRAPRRKMTMMYNTRPGGRLLVITVALLLLFGHNFIVSHQETALVVVHCILPPTFASQGIWHVLNQANRTHGRIIVQSLLLLYSQVSLWASLAFFMLGELWDYPIINLVVLLEWVMAGDQVYIFFIKIDR